VATALPIACDIRHAEQVAEAVKRTVETFGGIDILVNNASAIHLTGTLATPMKRFDLMHHVNTRGTFLCSQLCIPFLQKAVNPHILNLSPPLNMDARWFAPHLAYTITKFGMSMCVLGMAEELRSDGIAVNALWPRTAIATAAVRNLLGGEEIVARTRKPEIMGDAATGFSRDLRANLRAISASTMRRLPGLARPTCLNTRYVRAPPCYPTSSCSVLHRLHDAPDTRAI
jgi:citronellol/citronellal dehydrogenase